MPSGKNFIDLKPNEFYQCCVDDPQGTSQELMKKDLKEIEGLVQTKGIVEKLVDFDLAEELFNVEHHLMTFITRKDPLADILIFDIEHRHYLSHPTVVNWLMTKPDIIFKLTPVIQAELSKNPKLDSSNLLQQLMNHSDSLYLNEAFNNLAVKETAHSTVKCNTQST